LETTRKNLGELTDIGALAVLLQLGGLSVVDIGCGPGTVARELCARGATVLGVEPDPIQAEKNRNAAPVAGLTFVEAKAQALPVESQSVDGVFFFRSLHHVPVAEMDAALAEAARVLKRETGFLCVMEPGMTGTHFPVMRPFNDETMVRTQAQAALARTARRLFASEALFRFVQYPRYENFEAMVARVTGQTFINIQRENVETEEVRKLFAAGLKDGAYVFEQPMLLNLYRNVI
jgi:ubiquinone/menaquinone biosynthesis C-methylase UbiE